MGSVLGVSHFAFIIFMLATLCLPSLKSLELRLFEAFRAPLFLAGKVVLLEISKIAILLGFRPCTVIFKTIRLLLLIRFTFKFLALALVGRAQLLIGPQFLLSGRRSRWKI